MLYFAIWRVWWTWAVGGFGVLFSLRNLLNPGQLSWVPSQLPHKPVALGLDLRGGSYLLLSVDVTAAEREQLNSLTDNVRDALLTAKLHYTGLKVDGDAIVFTISDPSEIEPAKAALAKIDPTLTVTMGPAGAGKMQSSQQATDARRAQAVSQSIEIIRRRIDPTGTGEVTIQPQGQDRILVEIPGLDDPEHVKALLGKTAKLTFQFV